MIAKLIRRCQHPVWQQFGTCEHYAGHLVFLNVLLSTSKEATGMSPKDGTRPDGVLPSVAFALNTCIRTFRNS
jgi:hypothetical protein